MLFLLYAQLPPALGYRCAAMQAGFFRRKRVAEAGLIRQQMLRVFPQATN